MKKTVWVIFRAARNLREKTGVGYFRSLVLVMVVVLRSKARTAEQESPRFFGNDEKRFP